MNATVKVVECEHRRLCGITLSYSVNCSILVLNAYMPVDNNREDENHAAYVDILSFCQHSCTYLAKNTFIEWVCLVKPSNSARYHKIKIF